MTRETATASGQLGEDREWLFIDGPSSAFFRIGDELSPGETIGRTTTGEALRVTRPSRVVSIEYDWESDQLILGVAPQNESHVLDLLTVLPLAS